MDEWKPISGWKNFSDKEIIQCKNLFLFFKNKKGFTEKNAEILSHMVIFKQKYNGLKYSDEQEDAIKKALHNV